MPYLFYRFDGLDGQLAWSVDVSTFLVSLVLARHRAQLPSQRRAINQSIASLHYALLQALTKRGRGMNMPPRGVYLPDEVMVALTEHRTWLLLDHHAGQLAWPGQPAAKIVISTVLSDLKLPSVANESDQC